MKKSMLVILALFTSVSVRAVQGPKLDTLEIQPQIVITLPQYCDQFGKMFVSIVFLGLKSDYNEDVGHRFVFKYHRDFKKNNKLEIPDGYFLFSHEVLPSVPTLPSFKKQFKGKTTLTDREALWVYDLGFDTCLTALDSSQQESK
jgi:hypothetical protein